MIKRTEGQRAWASGKMPAGLARAPGVSAFQRLVPASGAVSPGNLALISGMPQNLGQNIRGDASSCLDRLVAQKQPKAALAFLWKICKNNHCKLSKRRRDL
jgi:hypothetical protein